MDGAVAEEEESFALGMDAVVARTWECEQEFAGGVGLRGAVVRPHTCSSHGDLIVVDDLPRYTNLGSPNGAAEDNAEPKPQHSSPLDTEHSRERHG